MCSYNCKERPWKATWRMDAPVSSVIQDPRPVQLPCTALQPGSFTFRPTLHGSRLLSTLRGVRQIKKSRSTRPFAEETERHVKFYKVLSNGNLLFKFSEI